MSLRVARGVAGGVELILGAQRLLVGVNVEMLQMGSGVTQRFRHGAGSHILLIAATKLASKVTAVERSQLAPHLLQGLLAHAVFPQRACEPAPQLLQRGECGWIFSQHAELVFERGEVALHLLGGDRADDIDLRLGLRVERTRCHAVGGVAHEGQRHQRHQQQCQQQRIGQKLEELTPPGAPQGSRPARQIAMPTVHRFFLSRSGAVRPPMIASARSRCTRPSPAA